MKTLYLYIGTPKTASTSVQRFLKQNRDNFTKYNYCFPLMPFSYPNVSVARNAHFLIYHEGDLIKEESSGKKQADRSELLKKGFDVFHKAFQTYDNVILADEGLWYAIGYDEKNFMDILPNDARENDYTVKIVVYLRRQDKMLYSLWNQKVKTCQTAETPKEFIKRILSTRPYITEYDRSLDLLASAFGSENLIVRRFEPSFWENKSICDNFLTAIGLDPSLPLEPLKEKINISISKNFIEIQREINSASFLTPEEKEQCSRQLNTRFSKKENTASYSWFSRDDTAKLLAHYQKGNEIVSNKYMKDGQPLFSDKIDDLPVWNPDNPEMNEDRFLFLLNLINDHYRNTEKQQRQINNLNKFREKVRHPFRTCWNKLFHSQKSGN